MGGSSSLGTSFSRSSHHPHSAHPKLINPKSGSNTSISLRRRIFAVVDSVSSSRSRDRGVTGGEESEGESQGRAICTTPGMACAGETETETDEPSRHWLPTARFPKAASRLSTSFSWSESDSLTLPPPPWQWFLFEFSRLLAIVPASSGFIWCLWRTYAFAPCPNRCTGSDRPHPDRIDYMTASLWALLTAHQCLSLTTGLLIRWRHYYTPLSTLVRLLALQGICWPATHLTVTVFEVSKRPAVVWALIGTCTCMSRSIQIWVVSNLPAHFTSSQSINKDGDTTDTREREKQRATLAESTKPSRRYGYVYWKQWNKWRRKRRWDWREVSIRCVLPAGILYFVMAWVGELRRELGGC